MKGAASERQKTHLRDAQQTAYCKWGRTHGGHDRGWLTLLTLPDQARHMGELWMDWRRLSTAGFIRWFLVIWSISTFTSDGLKHGVGAGVDPQLSTEGRGGSDGACEPEAGARAFTFSGRVVTPMPL